MVSGELFLSDLCLTRAEAEMSGRKTKAHVCEWTSQVLPGHTVRSRLSERPPARRTRHRALD